MNGRLDETFASPGFTTGFVHPGCVLAAIREQTFGKAMFNVSSDLISVDIIERIGESGVE